MINKVIVTTPPMTEERRKANKLFRDIFLMYGSDGLTKLGNFSLRYYWLFFF